MFCAREEVFQKSMELFDSKFAIKRDQKSMELFDQADTIITTSGLASVRPSV